MIDLFFPITIYKYQQNLYKFGNHRPEDGMCPVPPRMAANSRTGLAQNSLRPGPDPFQGSLASRLFQVGDINSDTTIAILLLASKCCTNFTSYHSFFNSFQKNGIHSK